MEGRPDNRGSTVLVSTLWFHACVHVLQKVLKTAAYIISVAMLYSSYGYRCCFLMTLCLSAWAMGSSRMLFGGRYFLMCLSGKHNLSMLFSEVLLMHV